MSQRQPLPTLRRLPWLRPRARFVPAAPPPITAHTPSPHLHACVRARGGNCVCIWPTTQGTRRHSRSPAPMHYGVHAAYTLARTRAAPPFLGANPTPRWVRWQGRAPTRGRRGQAPRRGRAPPATRAACRRSCAQTAGRAPSAGCPFASARRTAWRRGTEHVTGLHLTIPAQHQPFGSRTRTWAVGEERHAHTTVARD